MKIKILFFAKLREVFKKEEVEIALPEKTTVEEALHFLFEDKQETNSIRHFLLYAINQNYVSSDTTLKDGDELALIPPLAGG